ncbi:MAG TPA: FxLYD domain-containing protein [Candidatus Methylomirabilis sp.]|nr:FxLYD domain-containing protein [Candidatus Methylomirabilis sp.]
MTTARVAVCGRERAVAFALAVCMSLVAGGLLFAVPAATQARFRTTYNVKSRDARSVVLEGRVFNDTGVDVLDVWVTAEALSASGKVVGRGIAFVGSSIARGDSFPFEAKVPAAEDVENFRVSVSSYRSGREVQSP